MLVLTRKHQEKIRIGDHITITVLKTKGKTVRLGIEAPAEVPVLRGELSFAGQAVQWQGDVHTGEPRPPRLTSVEDSRAQQGRDHWPTKSQANGASRQAKEDAAPRVSLQRVPREQVSQALPKMQSQPKMADSAAPLRAMLDRRSVSV